MAIIEVNENQKEMLLEYLNSIYMELQSDGPYGSRSMELDRIKDLEDIKDLMNQIN